MNRRQMFRKLACQSNPKLEFSVNSKRNFFSTCVINYLSELTLLPILTQTVKYLDSRAEA